LTVVEFTQSFVLHGGSLSMCVCVCAYVRKIVTTIISSFHGASHDFPRTRHYWFADGRNKIVCTSRPIIRRYMTCDRPPHQWKSLNELHDDYHDAVMAKKRGLCHRSFILFSCIINTAVHRYITLYVYLSGTLYNNIIYSHIGCNARYTHNYLYVLYISELYDGNNTSTRLVVCRRRRRGAQSSTPSQIFNVNWFWYWG